MNTSIENLLDNEEDTVSKTITPKVIIDAINTLIEAFGYDCIFGIEKYPDDHYIKVIGIDDKPIQLYLKQLEVNGSVLEQLKNIGETEAYNKLIDKWADIDNCVYEDGHIKFVLPF